MITEDSVVSFFDRANPVPDVEGLDLEEVGASRHLELLEARNNTVTQVDTKQSGVKEDKRSGMYWLVAAIAVVVLGAGILFLNSGGNDAAAPEDIAVIESLMDDWNSHDGDAVAAHFTADAVFDATIHGPFLQPWVGRAEIAETADGYSVAQVWDDTFDYTQIGEELVFNVRFRDTDFNSVERPRGVAVVMNDGLIESLVFETDFVYYCLGDTTSRCMVRETGEIKQAE